jgi:hypothetical protein
MAVFRGFSILARRLQCIGHPGWSGENKPRFKELPMSIFDYASNRAVAAVFALSVSAMFMAAAIIPASPAGLVA